MSASEKDYGDARIAAQILHLRQKTGMSMEAFAARLGISQPTQSRIERVKRTPDAQYLRALHDHFSVDINALLAAPDESRARQRVADTRADYDVGPPRLPAELDVDETELVNLYRRATAGARTALMTMARELAARK